MIIKLLPTIIAYLLPIIVATYNIKKKNNKIHLGLLIYFFFLSGFRWQVGDDFVGYLQLIKLQDTFSILSIEPIEKLFMFISNYTGYYQLFFIFNSLLTVISLYIVTKQYKEIKEGLILVFLLLFAPVSFSIVRAVTALTFALIGNKYLMDKKYIKFTSIVLISSMIHISMLSLLVLPLIIELLHLMHRSSTKANIVLTTLLSLLFPYLVTLAYIIFSGTPLHKFSTYLEELVLLIQGRFLLISILLIILVGISYLFYKQIQKTEEKDNKLYNFSLLSGFISLILVTVLLVLFKNYEFPRVMLNFGFYAIFGLAYAVYKPLKKSNLIALLLLVVFLPFPIITLKIFPYNISHEVDWISRENIRVKLDLVSRIDYKNSTNYLSSTNGIVKTSSKIEMGQTFCEVYYDDLELQWCLISFNHDFGYEDLKYKLDHRYEQYQKYNGIYIEEIDIDEKLII